MNMKRWIDILSKLPGPVVAYAFEVWEEARTHRPSPADIRQIGLGRMASLREPKREDRKPFGPMDLSLEELARRRQIVAELTKERGPTLERILREASDKTGITIEQMKSVQRNAPIAQARFAVMLIARRITTMSLPQIAAGLGDRDHTTVMNGISRAEQLLAEDDRFRWTYDAILGALQ